MHYSIRYTIVDYGTYVYFSEGLGGTPVASAPNPKPMQPLAQPCCAPGDVMMRCWGWVARSRLALLRQSTLRRLQQALVLLVHSIFNQMLGRSSSRHGCLQFSPKPSHVACLEMFDVLFGAGLRGQVNLFSRNPFGAGIPGVRRPARPDKARMSRHYKIHKKGLGFRVLGFRVLGCRV